MKLMNAREVISLAIESQCLLLPVDISSLRLHISLGVRCTCPYFMCANEKHDEEFWQRKQYLRISHYLLLSFVVRLSFRNFHCRWMNLFQWNFVKIRWRRTKERILWNNVWWKMKFGHHDCHTAVAHHRFSLHTIWPLFHFCLAKFHYAVRHSRMRWENNFFRSSELTNRHLRTRRKCQRKPRKKNSSFRIVSHSISDSTDSFAHVRKSITHTHTALRVAILLPCNEVTHASHVRRTTKKMKWNWICFYSFSIWSFRFGVVFSPETNTTNTKKNRTK